MIPGFKEAAEKMVKTVESKNHDYGENEDPFNNFRNCERMGICSAEKGIMVRMCDKMSRISTLLDKPGKVEDEKLADTCQDLAAYALILKQMIEYDNK